MANTGWGVEAVVDRGHGVRAATPADIPVLAQVLVHAFHHDPAHRWILVVIGSKAEKI